MKENQLFDFGNLVGNLMVIDRVWDSYLKMKVATQIRIDRTNPLELGQFQMFNEEKILNISRRSRSF